ncbi:putative hydrophobic protein (TIGR00271 family) [Psychrobacter luti]|uniref:Putative hydrophobic protein (TIGR00271 family) n=1 Tax=Psychrobacter luti TaxID=198481 RepID=A0A839TE84_9GAMM|nr:DUF389 domain-containing protein [Psychrobacter luti]MBB3107410.1 putative hydrophobic protein (TIGR00271 family) [Psychrobacter luti]
MTSSNTDTTNGSLPIDESQDDFDPQIANNIDDDIAEPEVKIKMETVAPDVVVASLETPDTESQAVNDHTESDFLSTEEDFFQGDSDAEVTVEADKTDSNQQQSNDTQANNLKDEESLNNEKPDEKEALNQEQATIPAAKPQTMNDEKNINKNEPPINKEQNSKQIAVNVLEEDDVSNEGNEEEGEEVKEKKEAKLESYKQFVAEQFSNKKVDYPEVRVRIEANALPSKMYFIMNILSAIIASYGLVTNSAAVVIGAMLVAMMLGPITGVALAIIDHRMPLLRKSLVTVFLGISLVVLVGFVVGWLHKDQPLTAEILSRTQPTSMDLMIALAGGTAGAYAMVSPHLSVAVVGVAVATALVPPLAASGILFANGELQLGFGALLLAVTNIIAIQFTNALVLWVLGFRRLVKDDYKSNTYLTFLQRNAVTLLLLGGLGTYLTINLQTNAKQQVFESSVKETINSYFSDKGNVLTNTQFDKSDTNQVVRAVIRGETTPSSYDVRQIEAIISQDIADNFPNYLPIRLQLRYMPVQVIESHPLIQDKLDKTDVTILTN